MAQIDRFFMIKQGSEGATLGDLRKFTEGLDDDFVIWLINRKSPEEMVNVTGVTVMLKEKEIALIYDSDAVRDY